MSPLKKRFSTDNAQDFVMYNDISASKYEEFKVTKINVNNKHQKRIFGIDLYKIYNLKRDTNRRKTFFNVFENDQTKNPIRFIDDIISLKIYEPKKFRIKFREPDGSTHLLRYTC